MQVSKQKLKLKIVRLYSRKPFSFLFSGFSFQLKKSFKGNALLFSLKNNVEPNLRPKYRDYICIGYADFKCRKMGAYILVQQCKFGRCSCTQMSSCNTRHLLDFNII